jgi:hypothetical protein
MALFGRARTATAQGLAAALVLVLAFGNQAFTEWVARHTRPGTVPGWFARVLSWPSWAFGPHSRDLLAHDLRALLLLAFVALVLVMAAPSSVGAGALVVGWASLILGSALAAFVTAFLTTDATLLGAFDAAAGGSSYGLFVGWVIGIAVVAAQYGDD